MTCQRPEVVRVPRRPVRPLRGVPEVAEVAGETAPSPSRGCRAPAGSGRGGGPSWVVALAELLGRAVLVGVVAGGEHGPRDPVEQRGGRLVAVRAACADVAGADEHGIAGRRRRVAWPLGVSVSTPGLLDGTGCLARAARGEGLADGTDPRDAGCGSGRRASHDPRGVSRRGAGAAWPRTRAPPARPGRPRSRSVRAAACSGCHGARSRVRIRRRTSAGRSLGSSDMRAPA